ncbi:NAD-dependent epimerase/dehydratase family protein [Halomarina salina]|uniref:NAD-dependent epimerase/dehydratase family protein n=1 Tax=Halomarina salina TaxID=1872699 RepID=A0ABD5RT46_9EURY|nr:NAD-dependent epimerase/dehydratase family protein [Halomarina salina]
MHVLVVGGTGLISTGITRSLVAAGHDVTCLTRGETDAAVPSSVEFVHADRNDHDQFADQVGSLDVDCVVDMVCFTPEQARHAVETFAGDVEQYVFCSTIDVYHRPPERNPVTESAARSPPVSEYGRDKAAAEDEFFDAHGDAFATTVLRPWDTYGDGETMRHTLGTGSYYVDRIRKGKPIVVHGDGTSLWASCHRDDVARAFVGAVGNRDAYGEAYHVTGEEAITWNQYHHRVARALDAPDPDLVHIPTEHLFAAVPDRTEMLDKHFQYSAMFDNAKARRDLGFTYSIPLEEGVRRTVAWLDDHDAVDPWDSEDDDAIVDAWRETTDEFQAAVERRRR